MLSRSNKGLVSAHARLRTPNCLLGYFWVFYSQDSTTGIDAKYVKRRGFAQGCAFSGSQNPNLTLTLLFPQNRPFWGPFATVHRNFLPKTTFNIGRATCRRPLNVIVAP